MAFNRQTSSEPPSPSPRGLPSTPCPSLKRLVRRLQRFAHRGAVVSSAAHHCPFLPAHAGSFCERIGDPLAAGATPGAGRRLLHAPCSVRDPRTPSCAARARAQGRPCPEAPGRQSQEEPEDLPHRTRPAFWRPTSNWQQRRPGFPLSLRPSQADVLSKPGRSESNSNLWGGGGLADRAPGSATARPELQHVRFWDAHCRLCATGDPGQLRGPTSSWSCST